MTLIEIIENWNKQIIIDLKKEYNSSGRKASGDWEKQLSSEIVETKNGYSNIISGANYTYWLENGRKKNKDQSDKGLRRWAVGFGLSVIKDWVEDKSIITTDIDTNSLSISIAYKIARHGYQGKPFISKVINEKSINELKSSIGHTYISNIKSDIIKTLENGS